MQVKNPPSKIKPLVSTKQNAELMNRSFSYKSGFYTVLLPDTVLFINAIISPLSL